MKHFIGGYAFGSVFIIAWGLERAKRDMGDCIILAALTGWIFGLAAWGLLP